MKITCALACLLAAPVQGLRKTKSRSQSGVQPSSGCGQSFQWPQGSRRSNSITFNDPNLGNVSREYALKIPNSATTSDPLPLFIFLHGQGGAHMSTGYGFDSLGDTEGFYTMYPQGISEGSCGTGWNTGMQPDLSTCTSEAHSSYGTCCYESCRSLGKCSGNSHPGTACGWATCYDDVAYVNHLIDTIGEGSCINLNAVFISGESNGGMQMWELLERTPEKFAAIFPVYGSPLAGYGNVPAAASSVPMLYLTGRSDDIIPPAGGNGYGWQYLSAEQAVANVAAVHQCDSALTVVSTPSDGKRNLECREHLNCASGGRVILCMYDGGHSIPSQINHEDLTWWFASQYAPSNGPSPQPSPQPSPPPSPQPGGCTCDASHPYCWSDDSHCYRCATCNAWSRNTCPGNCTADYAGR